MKSDKSSFKILVPLRYPAGTLVVCSVALTLPCWYPTVALVVPCWYPCVAQSARQSLKARQGGESRGCGEASEGEFHPDTPIRHYLGLDRFEAKIAFFQLFCNMFETFSLQNCSTTEVFALQELFC